MVRRHGLRLGLGILAGLVIVLAGTNPAFAAAPRIILVTGGTPARLVVLDDWRENLAIMLAAKDPVDARAEGLAGRLSYRIAMFWGSEWDQYMQAGKDPRALRPDDADQFARYYPPTAAHAAVFAFDSIPGPGPLIRRLRAEGVSIFMRHGIGSETSSAGTISAPPTARPNHPAPGPAQLPSLLLGLGGAAATAGLWLSFGVVRRRRSPQ